MKELLKQMLPQQLWNILKTASQKKQYREWLNNGRPVPPPHLVKQLRIRKYSEIYGIKVLVETGTFLGDMVEAQKKYFDLVYSIELSGELYEKARARFKNDKNVKIVQGDSGKLLFELIKEIKRPVVFWLDGHYSAGETARGEKECPIFEELEAIFSGKPLEHILLIDDARLFVGKGDYPTIDELGRFVKSKNPKYNLLVEDDAICFVPIK